MSKYFFHLRDGEDVLLDEEGLEFEDMAALVAKTLLIARSIISHEALDGHIKLEQRIDVEDGDRTIVHCLIFEDAVSVTHAVRQAA